MGFKKGTILRRGICSVCGQDRTVTKEGLIQGHGDCPGAHEYPKRAIDCANDDTALRIAAQGGEPKLMGCDCPEGRTDGAPPCKIYVGHQRPDGFYCDCGHKKRCHPLLRREGDPHA